MDFYRQQYINLDGPAPRSRAYARETVIAEKFQATVMLGRANGRMKDICEMMHQPWRPQSLTKGRARSAKRNYTR